MAAFVEDLLNSRLVRRHMPVAVLAFGLVLCAWLMGSRLRALTHFSASIHTRNISFVAGHRTNTAGLFNSGSYPVDIVLHSRCRITSFDGPIPRDTGETLALRKVRLMALDTTEGSHVDLAVIEGFLRVRLTRPAAIKDAIAIIRLDRGSEVQGDALLNQYAHNAPDVEWRLSPAVDRTFEMSVYFLGQSPASERIELQDGERVSFERNGRSGILGSESQITLSKRPIRLTEDLKLNHLRNAIIEALTLRPSPGPKAHQDPAALPLDSMDVEIRGDSDDILAIDGTRRSQMAETLLDRFWPASLANRTKVFGALFCAFATVVFAYMKRKWFDSGSRKRRPRKTRRSGRGVQRGEGASCD